MNSFIRTFFISLVFVLFVNSLSAAEHGEVSIIDNKEVVWNKELKHWQGIEEFWRAYAQKNGGLRWKDSRIFPQYSKVKEFDLFMAKNDEGLCLMEFFHERWRRANDVRRWDDKFNEYEACATILN